MTFTYKDIIEESHLDIVYPAGNSAVCCFWQESRNDTVMIHQLQRRGEWFPADDKIAVIGNAFHWGATRNPPTVDDMWLSAQNIVKALMWNPQITKLWLYGTAGQVRAMTDALDKIDAFVVLLPTDIEWKPSGAVNRQKTPLGLYQIRIGRMPADKGKRVKHEITLPPPPETIEPRYRVGHTLHGSNLTNLHAELLQKTLIYGDRRDGRTELGNVTAVWHAPFDLGRVYEPELQRLTDYAEGRGTGEAQYLERLNWWYNEHYKDWTEDGDGKRHNWYPIWRHGHTEVRSMFEEQDYPGDELDTEHAPCMVGFSAWKDTATAVFRAHNFASAWPDNMFLVRHFHELKAGRMPESVVIHSIQGGVREAELDKARKLINDHALKATPEISDRGGAWKVTNDEEGRIVATLYVNGTVFREFKGRKEHAVRMAIMRAGLEPVDRGHAMYLGAEIGKREQ